MPQKEQDAARKAVRRPDPDYDIFVADQDYGYHSGWAVGSLTMAEKILQAAKEAGRACDLVELSLRKMF